MESGQNQNRFWKPPPLKNPMHTPDNTHRGYLFLGIWDSNKTNEKDLSNPWNRWQENKFVEFTKNELMKYQLVNKTDWLLSKQMLCLYSGVNINESTKGF